MRRKPRIDIADGVQHVMNRGLERRDIVRDDDDRAIWWSLFERVARRCGWRVFAVALLDNHFWLDWRTVLAEFAGTEGVARVAYKRFVEAGLRLQLINPFPAWEEKGSFSSTHSSKPFVLCLKRRPPNWLGVEGIDTPRAMRPYSWLASGLACRSTTSLSDATCGRAVPCPRHSGELAHATSRIPVFACNSRPSANACKRDVRGSSRAPTAHRKSGNSRVLP